MLWIGLAAVAVALVFTCGTKGLGGWSQSRASATAAKRKLSDVETDPVKLAGLISQVPAFETPQPEEKQASLFREKLHEQLKKAGINTEPLTLLAGKRLTIGAAGYRTLKIKCKAKCKLDQLLDFLAGLKENPYFVGVEELQIRCDTKEPPEKRKDKDIDVDLVVSTFVKDSVSKAGAPTRSTALAKPAVEARSVDHANPSSRQ